MSATRGSRKMKLIGLEGDSSEGHSRRTVGRKELDMKRTCNEFASDCSFFRKLLWGFACTKNAYA